MNLYILVCAICLFTIVYYFENIFYENAILYQKKLYLCQLKI